MGYESELAKQWLLRVNKRLERDAELSKLLQEKKQCLDRVEQINFQIRLLEYKPRQLLILPRLNSDLRTVDRSANEYLEPQTRQIIGIFRVLTTPSVPYIQASAIREYIEENFDIPEPSYWMARTNPKEPPRWWKNIYDKVIERLDLTEHLIVRREITGKKGQYALREHIPLQPMLPFVVNCDIDNTK